MKCSAHDLGAVLGQLASYGSSKVETNNIIIYRRPEDHKFIFGVASRSTHLTVASDFTAPPGDSFFLDSAISVNEKTINSIVSGMGKSELDISLNTQNAGYITLVTSKEKYDLAYQIPTQEDVNRVFKTDPSGAQYLFKDVPASTLKHISTVINNIGTLCADNQFRSIIHRKGKEFKCIFVTGTTLNTVELSLPNNEAYDAQADHGIDTNTNYLPRAMSTILTYLKGDEPLTMMYDTSSVFYISGNMIMRTSFEAKGESMEKSISMYYNLKTIIQKSNANVLTLKIPGKDLEEMLTKASLIMNKSVINRLDSHIPLYISSDKEVRLDVKSTAGSYASQLTEQVAVEGLPPNYKKDTALYNMNIPMSKAMLNTINKTYSGRVSIELRDTIENKTYVCLKNETNDGVKYFIRLRR